MSSGEQSSSALTRSIADSGLGAAGLLFGEIAAPVAGVRQVAVPARAGAKHELHAARVAGAHGALDELAADGDRLATHRANEGGSRRHVTLTYRNLRSRCYKIAAAMRLPGYVAAELTVAAVLLVGGGAGARLGVRHLHSSLAAQTRTASTAAPLTERHDLSDLGDLRVSLESSGTFLGMSDELLLERVRTQPIVRFKFNHGGSSISFRVDFADGSRAAWKPTQTNTQTIPRKEIAAYRLNRLLGLNAVPPAAPRAVSRDELFAHLHPESLEFLPRIKAETIFGPNGQTLGTASYWIPVIKDSGFDKPEGEKQVQAWLSQGEPIPPAQESMARQVSDLI